MADETDPPQTSQKMSRRQFFNASIGVAAGLAAAGTSTVKAPEMSVEEMYSGEVKKYHKIGLDIVNAVDDSQAKERSKNALIDEIPSLWSKGDLVRFSIEKSDGALFTIEKVFELQPSSIDSHNQQYLPQNKINFSKGVGSEPQTLPIYVIRITNPESLRDLTTLMELSFGEPDKFGDNVWFSIYDVDSINEFIDSHTDAVGIHLKNLLEGDEEITFLAQTGSVDFNGEVKTGYEDLLGPHLSQISVPFDDGIFRFDQKGRLSSHQIPKAISSSLELKLSPDVAAYDAKVVTTFGIGEFQKVLEINASEQTVSATMGDSWINFQTKGSQSYRDLKASVVTNTLIAASARPGPPANI